ncbi:hypothetical protein NBRC111894_1897 [Sporolactobacillus inulinus]|uniref:Uncharacterized protein n=1 Tax=Sporolactobacillus inulinus TaxID=2078 RepID=A0A4Y1ZBN7_9BACL|nr:hypothetical protein NBRC111894_1897 [Sporolactobacillus inulinus]
MSWPRIKAEVLGRQRDPALLMRASETPQISDCLRRLAVRERLECRSCTRLMVQNHILRK